MAAVLVVGMLALAAVALPWLTGALDVRDVQGAFGPYLGLGVLAHLVVALPAVGIAALWSPPAVRRTGTTLAATAVCLILAILLDNLSRSPSWAARLLPHAVPPFEVARAMSDGTPLPAVLSSLVPSLAGALVFTAGAISAYVVLARRRS